MDYIKNILKAIIAILVFILGFISIEIFVIKKEDNNKTSNTELSYLVDDFVGYYETIKLSDSEKEQLNDIFKKLNYKQEKIDIDLVINPKYKLVFGDSILYLSDDEKEYANLFEDGYEEIIATKNLKSKLKEIIKEKNIDSVYLFERKDISTTTFNRIELNEEDKKIFKERFSYSILVEPVNLMIVGKYVLVVNNQSLAFDDINSSYGMYGNEMVIMNSELKEVLKKYIINENECCSCCPDAEPGDVCISMCCPCN